jgi:phosphoribulokinase
MMEGKKIGSYKKDFEVVMFFSSQNIDFPFLFEETLGAFLFSSSFFNTFSLSLSFSMLHLCEDLGILMINEEKNTLQKFLFR